MPRYVLDTPMTRERRSARSLLETTRRSLGYHGEPNPQLSADGASVEHPRSTILSMRGIPIIIGTALVAMSLTAAPGRALPTRTSGGAPGSSPAAQYSVEVTSICAGALLFEGTHELGTRSDALEIAAAIRASTAQRLALVTALSVPPELQDTSSRWIATQRRLASLYARLWVRIYDTIDSARTRAQRATLPKRLQKLVHAPDALKSAAGRLELKLHVPDCTGGG